MAVDMFLKIDTVDGETIDKVFSKDKAIDVLAWSWGGSNSGTTHQGGGGGGGKSNFQDMSITKYLDTASPVLLMACADGTHFTKAKLTVRKAGGKAPVEYFKIEMDEVLITSLSTGGSGGEDRLTENVSLNFAKFSVYYTPQAPDGTAGTEIGPNTWDISANATA